MAWSKALEEAGAHVSVISSKDGKVQGFKHHDKADQITVDMDLNSADPEKFDAVLLPGGVLNADALRIEKKRRNSSARSTSRGSLLP